MRLRRASAWRRQSRQANQLNPMRNPLVSQGRNKRGRQQICCASSRRRSRNRACSNSRLPAEPVKYAHSRFGLCVVVPAVTKLTGSFMPTGRPGEEGLRLVTAHVMTPETEFSTHYFYCNTRNYGLEDEALTRQISELTNLAFAGEDKPMIEARMGASDFWSLKPAFIASDKGHLGGR